MKKKDIKNMVATDKFCKSSSKVNHIKICNLQEENGHLKSEITELKVQLSTTNEKHVLQQSEFQCKLQEREREISNLQTQ